MNDPKKSFQWERTNLNFYVTKYWPVLIFWLFIFFTDILNRLVFSVAVDNIDLYSNKIASSMQSISLSDRSFTAYQAKLSRYHQKNQVVTELKLEPLAADSVGRDNNVLRSAQYSYRLLAVFGADEHFAVLHRSHNQTGVIDMIEVRVGDNFEGFLVNELFATGLTAVHLSGEIAELRLFRPQQPSPKGGGSKL